MSTREEVEEVLQSSGWRGAADEGPDMIPQSSPPALPAVTSSSHPAKIPSRPVRAQQQQPKVQRSSLTPSQPIPTQQQSVPQHGGSPVSAPRMENVSERMVSIPPPASSPSPPPRQQQQQQPRSEMAVADTGRLIGRSHT